MPCCTRFKFNRFICEFYRTTDYKVENETVSVTIPTQGSVPMISISDWIMLLYRDVPKGFDWNLTWNDYKTGFGSIGSDFWLGSKDCRWDGGLLAGLGQNSPSDDVWQLPTALGMAGDGDWLLVLDRILDVLH